MDENIHRDKLDDFVNRSFENYSEDPSPSLWDAIERDLESPVIPQKREFRLPVWKYAAALLILLLSAALVTQHLFYKEKMQAILKDKAQNDLDKDDTKSVNTETPKVGNGNSLSQNGANKSSSNIVIKNNNSNREVGYAANGANRSEKRNNSRSGIIKSGGKNRPINPDHSKSSQQSTAYESNVVIVDNSKPEPVVTVNDANQIENKETGAVIIAQKEVISQNDLESLPSNSAELSFKDLPFATAISPILKNLNSGWYMGVMVAPSLTYESIVSRGFPDPMHNKHEVANEQTGSVYNTEFNIRAGKFFNSHWGLESGVGYSSLTRNATHKPDFKFKDRNHGSPGGPPDDNHEFDFTYELNTFGGSTSVDVRVSNVDSTFKFKDDDALNFKISTKETVRTLRIPLLGVYKMDFGRVGLIAKAGLIGNILLTNDLQITGLETNNTQLDGNINGHPKPPVKSDDKIQLGYLVSLGAVYHLNPHLSIVAEPYYTSNFPKSCTDGRPLPRYYTVGLNAGLTYSF